eukprot:SAG22_NODE_2484_length_2524_cov_14.986804_1_plen_209_part_00
MAAPGPAPAAAPAPKSGPAAAGSLAAELGAGTGSIVAFVGGGGKTSLIFSLSRQLKAAGLRVLCTTTTKMMAPRVPADCAAFLVEQVELRAAEAAVAAAFAEPAGGPVMLAGGFDVTMPGNRRVVGIPPDWAGALLAAGCCDCVLVEADGSRKLPFKAPQAPTEPVLPTGLSPAAEAALVVVAVAGMDAIGVPIAEDFVCRCAAPPPL